MNRYPIKQAAGSLEARLQQAARDLPYPPTPDLAKPVNQQLAARPNQIGRRSTRRLALTIMAAAMIVAILLAVPSVRAAIVDMVYQGMVQVFLSEPSPTTTPLFTITPAASAEASATAGPSSWITPRPSATPISAASIDYSPTPAKRPAYLLPSIDTTPPIKQSGSFY